MKPIQAVVQSKHNESALVATLTANVSGLDVSSVKPGQFFMVYAFGVGEIPVSVSGIVKSDNAVQFTIRSVGAVSRALTKLSTGSAFGVRGPFGTPWPLEHITNEEVVFVAGGLGIAPLRQAIYDVIEKVSGNGQHKDKVSIFIGARTPEDLLFPTDLDIWQEKATLYTTVDFADNTWKGRVGVVTNVIEQIPFDPNNCLAYVCGPEIMMQYALKTFTEAQVPADKLFLSMERNMKCATGHCGHCQFGPLFICKDGPVLPYSRVATLLKQREL